MPRVEIVQKQNSTVRRLYIQGHNGKVSKSLRLHVCDLDHWFFCWILVFRINASTYKADVLIIIMHLHVHVITCSNEKYRTCTLWMKYGLAVRYAWDRDGLSIPWGTREIHVCTVPCTCTNVLVRFSFFFFQIYPYLVLNDSQVSQSRSEERVLQLFSMLNLFLDKDKVRVQVTISRPSDWLCIKI